MERWKEHFINLFFDPLVVDGAAVGSIPQQDLIPQMDCEPTGDEVNLPIKQINTGKAHGLNGKGGEKIRSTIFNFIEKIPEGSLIPQDWINRILVSPYKGAVSKSECDNNRGIHFWNLCQDLG